MVESPKPDSWFNGLSTNRDKPINQLIRTFTVQSLNSPIKPIKPTDYNSLRKELLDFYKTKQDFRVAIGKSEWIYYSSFNQLYNLREILNDEIVIEFDSKDSELVYKAISETAINLRRAGYTFELWEHGGKSPHIHIHNLPIKELDKNKRALFKKIFIRKYVPLDYLPYVDLSLTGIHLIAIEWMFHWKGCYGYKELINIFDDKEIV